MKLRKVQIYCLCCKKTWFILASQSFVDGATYCDNCNRIGGKNTLDGPPPCDHKPWKRRWRRGELVFG